MVAGPPRARLFVFGSYRLSVHLPDSDLDVLITAPPLPLAGDAAATRDRFFATFAAVLRKHLQPPPTALHVVEAHVPVIKLDWRGIEVDCAFACCDLPDPADVVSDDVMSRADERSRNSLCGVRNGEAVLLALPNHAAFWAAVRAVKLWARRRVVYGNLYGYLGGGAVAILVARVCQQRPFRLSSSVVARFFADHRAWLAEAARAQQAGKAPAVLSVADAAAAAWGRTLAQRPLPGQVAPAHLLVVPNPTSPYTNTTRNITAQQLRVVLKEVEGRSASCARGTSRTTRRGRSLSSRGSRSAIPASRTGSS